MDFKYSFEQTALQDSVRRFCRANYSPTSRKALLRSPEGFSRGHWRFFASQGWLAALLPVEVGGLGGSVVEASIMLTEFGRALVLEPFVSCVILAAKAVDAAGCEAQRAALLAPVAEGRSMLAFAHNEVRARGMPNYVGTRATRVGDGYLLSGQKILVQGGPSADRLIVSARLAGDACSADDVSLFIVERDQAGLTRLDYPLIDGLRASDLTLSNVLVPLDALLGEAGNGMAAIRLALDHSLVATAAEACGAMDTLIGMTREYLKSRSQYGAMLSTYQALQHRIADMMIESELSHSMVLHGLTALSQADPRVRGRGASATKVRVAEGARFVGKNAIQLHGGIGMTEEFSVGQYFKRLIAIAGQFGDVEHHLRNFSEPPA